MTAHPADAPRNDELLAALRHLQQENTAEAGRRVHAALRSGPVLVPVRGEPPADGTVTEESRVEVLMLTDAQGRRALPVFTDRDSIATWLPEGATFVAIDGAQLTRMLGESPPDALLINVAGPVGGELNREQIEALAAGTDPGTTTVRFSALEDPPVGLVPLLRETLADRDEVVEGYLVSLSVGDLEPALTLALVFAGDPDEDAMRATFEAIGEHVREAVGEAGRLDLIPVGGELLEVMRQRIEPIYEGGFL